ncbi:MAG TPA: hypothetical protein PL033_17705 [Candidatus Brocadiia bacterium]|nr:hypothetical protein [Candidatus Brocadiia bacterium]
MICRKCGAKVDGPKPDACASCGGKDFLREDGLEKPPWDRRREIGYLAAFIQTPMCIILSPGKYCLTDGEKGEKWSAESYFLIMLLIGVTSHTLSLFIYAAMSRNSFTKSSEIALIALIHGMLLFCGTYLYSGCLRKAFRIEVETSAATSVARIVHFTVGASMSFHVVPLIGPPLSLFLSFFLVMEGIHTALGQSRGKVAMYNVMALFMFVVVAIVFGLIFFG